MSASTWAQERIATARAVAAYLRGAGRDADAVSVAYWAAQAPGNGFALQYLTCISLGYDAGRASVPDVTAARLRDLERDLENTQAALARAHAQSDELLSIAIRPPPGREAYRIEREMLRSELKVALDERDAAIRRAEEAEALNVNAEDVEVVLHGMARALKGDP